MQLVDEAEDVARQADARGQAGDLLGQEVEAGQAGRAAGEDEAGGDELELGGACGPR